MIAPGTRVLAAVSGGSDSMALMTILSELSSELRIELAAAHFDHGIRPEAARERRLVERAAGKLEIPPVSRLGRRSRRGAPDEERDRGDGEAPQVPLSRRDGSRLERERRSPSDTPATTRLKRFSII